MPSGPFSDPNRLHLWVVLTDPCVNEANLIVSFSSVQPGRFHDPGCIVEAGEHRRIKVQSWAYTVWYNFVKQHKSIKGMSPAMAAGVSKTLWSMTDLAEMVDAGQAKPGKRRLYKKSNEEISN